MTPVGGGWVDVRGGVLFELETTIFQSVDDLSSATVGHKDVVREVSRDEEDRSDQVSMSQCEKRTKNITFRPWQEDWLAPELADLRQVLLHRLASQCSLPP